MIHELNFDSNDQAGFIKTINDVLDLNSFMNKVCQIEVIGDSSAVIVGRKESTGEFKGSTGKTHHFPINSGRHIEALLLKTLQNPLTLRIKILS